MKAPTLVPVGVTGDKFCFKTMKEKKRYNQKLNHSEYLELTAF